MSEHAEIAAREGSRSLLGEIRAQIEAKGSLPVSDYMRRCLAHTYAGGRMLGRDGDFVTAPEISQIFGELLGLWAAVVWQQMGSPVPVHLVELGPGRGTMMADMLRAIRRVPAFAAAVSVHMVETSPGLTRLQQSLLTVGDQRPAIPLAWHTALSGVPEGPAIIIANELLDAFPVRQLVGTAEGWRERCVGVGASGQLTFVAGPSVSTIPDELASVAAVASAGDILEIHQSQELAVGFAQRMRTAPVAALLIDYGHVESALGDTLQAVRRHAFEPPLHAPGEADVTAQVDFAQVASGLRRHGLAVDGPVSQGAFLSRLGITERASRLMSANPGQANAIEMAVGRLLSPSGMGARFQAIGARSPHLPPLPGLAA